MFLNLETQFECKMGCANVHYAKLTDSASDRFKFRLTEESLQCRVWSNVRGK